MAQYTPVPTVFIGNLWEAVDFNQYINDNFDYGTGLVTTKGDLLVATGDKAAARMGVGANNQVLVADSGESTGVKWSGNEGVASGMIILWSGAVVDIPSGWVICNGANSTPDLRNRFVVGAGDTYAVGATGGATALDISHSHTMDGVADAGTHDHSLSFGSESAHTHTFGTANSGACSAASSANTGSDATLATGTHTHQFTGESPPPDSSHTHGKTFPSEADHSHTLTTAAASKSSMATVPPYYALAYIMKEGK